MFLLVPAHSRCPGQNPESCKMVVVVVVVIDQLLMLILQGRMEGNKPVHRLRNNDAGLANGQKSRITYEI